MLLLSLVVVLLVAFEALAQAPSDVQSPFDVALFATYAWVIGISCLGGIASFVRKVRSGQARPFNLVELLGELVVSAFTGMLTYWFCRWAELNEWATAAYIGVASHMGSRAIFMGEQAFERIVRRFTMGDEQ